MLCTISSLMLLDDVLLDRGRTNGWWALTKGVKGTLDRRLQSQKGTVTVRARFWCSQDIATKAVSKLMTRSTRWVNSFTACLTAPKRRLLGYSWAHEEHHGLLRKKAPWKTCKNEHPKWGKMPLDEWMIGKSCSLWTLYVHIVVVH